MLKNLLLIDNNDSFTWNLVQLVNLASWNVVVVPCAGLLECNLTNFAKIMISPGPDVPSSYPRLRNFIDQYHKLIPMLGICLGHQALAEYFGCRLVNMPAPLHGIESPIEIVSPDIIFDSVPSSFPAGRYHSWEIERTSVTSSFIVTSVDDRGSIMSFRHKQYNLRGLQFHPESFLTRDGAKIISNWLNKC